MIFGPEILALHTALVLTGGGRGTSFVCKLPKAPEIKVDLVTDEIKYDFSQSAAALSAIQSGGGANTARANPDAVSGGLREDKPEVRSQLSWAVRYEENTKVGCMWFDEISITVHLRPKIYVAREFNQGQCREQILAHEQKHIAVDRKVMNQFALSMGNAVQGAVNRTGPMGPFNMRDIDTIKARSSRTIESTIAAQSNLMQQQMRQLQGQVDSPAEYKRVSSFCKGIKAQKR